MLKQLFTSVSVNSGDIYLATLLLRKYPPIFTSISVNNYLLFSKFIFRVSDQQVNSFIFNGAIQTQEMFLAYTTAISTNIPFLNSLQQNLILIEDRLMQI